MKMCSDIQNLKEAIASRPALWEKNLSPSSRKKMIPDGNIHLYKGMKNTRNGKYVAKQIFLFKKKFFFG